MLLPSISVRAETNRNNPPVAPSNSSLELISRNSACNPELPWTCSSALIHLGAVRMIVEGVCGDPDTTPEECQRWKDWEAATEAWAFQICADEYGIELPTQALNDRAITRINPKLKKINIS